LLQTAVPDSVLLVQLEFAPYCTTVDEATLNAWPSSATLIQLESSLLSSPASLSAAGSAVEAVVDAADKAGASLL